ncbi:hypothetical protein [Nocardia sp. NPDC050710]|uniref:hypothetical protein n=1 Tax=Nocardia sp. NPDC050710 TaxID=3157220 RepID=UPI0033FFD505
MALRLAWGLAERDRRGWSVATGAAIDPRARDLGDGAPIVLGPVDAGPDRVAAARAELSALMAVGGVVIAGAGVDLGDGFRSARLAGATGDRRDAVCAALRVLGLAGAGRLGDRAATLVALFGVAATKPVGAAAESAIAQSRWAALELASAAADVLGPEQLEQILALRISDGTEPLPAGAPSALAENLRRVLEPYPRRRRLTLLTDLWQQVDARHRAARDRARLLASQDLDIVEELSERYRRFDEEAVIQLAQDGAEPLTVAAAVRFVPTWDHFWKHLVVRLFQDAVAATVLLRAAIAVHEHGVQAGMERVRDQIAAASELFLKSDIQAARKRVGDQSPLAARPICAVRELDMWLRRGQTDHRSFEHLVRKRLATALAYGTVVNTACHDLLCRSPWNIWPDSWDLPDLRTWRAAVGYTETRPPADWSQRPLVSDRDLRPLGARLDADPEATELAADMVWYADLADALVQIRAPESARIEYGYVFHFDADPAPLPPEPLTPRLDSIPLAVAGAAQLLALGATAPARCKTWAQLCEGLMASGAVTQALISEFEVPDALLAADGSTLPGTDVRIQVARTAGRLAEWSDYMGNCIAGPWYQDEARDGRSVLIALRDPEDTVLVNAELRAAGAGWHVNEIRGRFNDDPDPALDREFRRWVRELRAADPEVDTELVVLPASPGRRRSAPDGVRELGPHLLRAIRRSTVDTDACLTVLAALVGRDDPHPKTLTTLRRAGTDRLARICVAALDARTVSLPELWSVTDTRPLAAAVTAMDPQSVARYPRLRRLSDDAPLPSKALRALIEEPEIAIARSMDIVAIRLRRVLGGLAVDDHPAMAPAVVRDPRAEVLCPLVVAITCAGGSAGTVSITEPRADTVPGFPASTLSDPDGPWQRTWPAAAELGATTERFWAQVAETGVLVPASWLIARGWPGLWNRAAARSR